MKVAASLLFLATIAYANGETATLTTETKLQLGKGSIILEAGTVVEVVNDDGVDATILYRNLKGRVPLATVGIAANPAKAVAKAQTPAEPTPAKAENTPTVEEQMRIAADALAPTLKLAESLMIQGKFEEANARILLVFPEPTRTPVEKLELGNIFFQVDPNLAYELHRQAAEALPNNADVLFEWALDQHRAKQYEGAARTYDAFSKLRPTFAPAFGLAAECAIRNGDLANAVVLWKTSESAKNGTLEQFEAMVCEVNGHIQLEPTRVRLLRLAQTGKEDAAAELLFGDVSWSPDWWNTGPSFQRLENDLSVVKKEFPKPGPELRAALCAAACTLQVRAENKTGVPAILTQSGFLLDQNSTLPTNGRAVSQLLEIAITNSPLDRKAARAKFGERILAMARKSMDAEMYNAAAYLYLDTDKLGDIDQEAWDRTHDSRFAASCILGLARAKKLTIKDPLLQRALKEFPEDSEIAHIALEVAIEANVPVQNYLVNAIKAEYTKFSSARPGVDFPRPSAWVLQKYFKILESTQPKIVAGI